MRCVMERICRSGKDYTNHHHRDSADVIQDDYDTPRQPRMIPAFADRSGIIATGAERRPGEEGSIPICQLGYESRDEWGSLLVMSRLKHKRHDQVIKQD